MKKNQQQVASELELDKDRGIVVRNGRPVRLTQLEISLLEIFMQQPNRIFSKIELLQKAEASGLALGRKSLAVHIHNLRKKIDHDFENTLLKTVIGVGYLLKMKTG